jgi:hypothetical protein
MAKVSCGCNVPKCKATPHVGKPRCSATCDAPTWGDDDRWSGSDTTWDGELDWNVRKIGDKIVPVCRECNLMMAMTDEESDSSAQIGEFDRPATKQAVGE